MKYEGEYIENMEWVESYKNCEIIMDSLVGCVCIHNQNPCPWWLFDNIVEVLKKWEKILYI